jgi:murein peptide amidase A
MQTSTFGMAPGKARDYSLEREVYKEMKEIWTSLVTLLIASQIPAGAFASIYRFDQIVEDGYTPIRLTNHKNLPEFIIKEELGPSAIQHLCFSLGPYFQKYGWESQPCGDVEWQAKLKTQNGHPLLFAKFGNSGPTTLILSAVHPDEMTPIPMGFRLARYLKDHPEVYKGKYQVIIAPLVNPDGFIRNVPARTNANGIDPNRNFLTLDWYENSKKFWQGKKERRFRHFPGYFPNSEVETLFQMQLIEEFRPAKILTVHAPLGFLDYDAPPPQQSKDDFRLNALTRKLVDEISAKSDNYRVVNFSIYPGSLGNFAGHERNIMTITLELKTTDPKKVDEYWQQFLPGILHSISFDAEDPVIPSGRNATNFLSMLLRWVDIQ